jgi:hypothetical protein
MPWFPVMLAMKHKAKKQKMRIASIALAALMLLTVSCGGGGGHLTSDAASGPYEFAITSNVTGGVTLVETNLAASGNQTGASGPSQVQILTFEKKTWYVNGICPGSQPGQNSVSASLNGNKIGLTFDIGGNPLSGQGQQTGTTITGNYSVTGSSCPDLIGETALGYQPGTDTGGFVGNQVPALAGTFAGPLILPDGTDNVSFALAENEDQSLTVTAQVTGPVDNGTFTLTGSAVGNVMFVSGTLGSQTSSLLGYYDRTGTYTGMPNSILVFDNQSLAKVGLLIGQ